MLPFTSAEGAQETCELAVLLKWLWLPVEFSILFH